MRNKRCRKASEMLSRKRTRGQTEKEIPQWIDENGFSRVRLLNDSGVWVDCFVHELVASVVLGRSLPPGTKVTHIDRNKQHNHPDNLKIELPEGVENATTGY